MASLFSLLHMQRRTYGCVMRKRLLTLIVVLAAAVAVVVPVSLTAQSSRLVIASGLDNPRGLDFGQDGALYVAEAGRGGVSALCLPQGGAPPTAPPSCYGPTGAVTRVTGSGSQQRIVTGLPSISFGSGGAAYLLVGLGGNPAARAPFEAAGIRLGRIYRISSTGQATDILDVSAHEAAANPDGGVVDSNPYSLQLLSGGAVFTDAGGNSLVRIAPTGAMTTLAAFPNRFVPNPFAPGTIPMQAVPTTVVQAPDGSFFVGELTGFPFPVGAARVYRVPAAGGTPVVVAEGFTNIIDIVADPSGGGYVLEHDADGIRGPGTAGRLIRVNASGAQTVLTNAGLTLPGGIAIGPDGALYVTNRSTSPGAGEVVRLTP
jgi:sugar lactone lactonase YvrE